MPQTTYPSYTLTGKLYYHIYSIDIQIKGTSPLTVTDNSIPISVSVIGILQYQGETGISVKINNATAIVSGVHTSGPHSGIITGGILTYTGETGISVNLLGVNIRMG